MYVYEERSFVNQRCLVGRIPYPSEAGWIVL